MPFALIFIAVALIVAGFRGTQKCLYSLMSQDFGGQFLLWAAAIFVVGGIGYVKPIAPISTALLILLIVVLFLSHGGVFSQASTALKSSANAPATPTVPAATTNTTSFGVLSNLPSLSLTP